MGFLPRATSGRIRLRLFADYCQFYLQDERSAGDLSDAWTAQATDDRIAVAPGVIGVGTLAADEVRVVVEVSARAPLDDSSRWDHITECGLDAQSGTVVVAGCTDYFPDARRIEVPPGTLRVRVSSQLGGKQLYRVQLWPEVISDAIVVKRWIPPPAAPPPPVVCKPPRTRKKAAEQARLGNTQVALDALIRFADAGDASASASAAEILAYQGRWEQTALRATELIAHPEAVYAGNVLSDMCLLVRRASTELGDPGLIARAVAAAPNARESVVRACLIEGRPLRREPPAGPDEVARYREAVRKSMTTKRFAGKPDDRSRHVFALAVVFRVHDQIVSLWPSTCHLLDFGHSVDTARVLAQRGETTAAWQIIESTVSKWWPVDYAQVAPVVLLVDPDLSSLMTAARCAQVLATPRGAEAG